jgi:hypothetical protein
MDIIVYMYMSFSHGNPSCFLCAIRRDHCG